MTSKCSKNKKVVTDVLCILSYRFENAKPIGPYIRFAISIYWRKFNWPLLKFLAQEIMAQLSVS